jgi:hypothetical protein
MKAILQSLRRLIGVPALVEFDYVDTTGSHHGRCYVRCICANDTRIKRMMRSFGYTNIHIA